MLMYKNSLVWSIVILLTVMLIILTVGYKKSDESKQTHSLNLPILELSNEDSDFSKWIVFAMMLESELSEDFIRKNVYISDFRILAFEGSVKATFLSFTIFYSIDNKRITKSFRIEDDGLISIITEPNHPQNESLLLASDFMELYRQIDKNEILEYAASNTGIIIAEFKKLSRLDQVEIEHDETVIYNNKLIPFGDIHIEGLHGVCYTTFHVNGKGVQLPILFPLK